MLKINEKDFSNDFDVMKMLIKKRGAYFEHASLELRNNFDIVMEAVKNNGELKYASDELRNNFDIVMAAVICNGENLKYASNILRNNFDIVMAAVRQNGYTLYHASNILRNNFDIVMAAIRQKESAVKYMGTNLQFNNINNIHQANYIIKLLLKYVQHE